MINRIEIVFENEYFLIVDKPACWLTVPSRVGEKDGRPCLGIELQKHKGMVFPVHRLDCEVSGLVIFARTPDSHRRANLWFENKLVKKTYQAWTEITESAESFIIGEAYEWRSVLLRGKKRAYENKNGKLAITKAKLIGDAPLLGFKEWLLEPVTGRAHQLRFELFKHGYPIAGDTLYGAKKTVPFSGMALRAQSIEFLDKDEIKNFFLPEKISVGGLADAYQIQKVEK